MKTVAEFRIAHQSHEATHVGVGAALRAEDVLAPVYRDYGTQPWRGVTMREILLYWGGDERGNDARARRICAMRRLRCRTSGRIGACRYP